jgi:two-component system sensor histidine kinase/response regulator
MSGKEILIVEDEIITQNMLKTALANAGYVPIVAASGAEAIQLAKERVPSLIVLDIMLPDIDGGEVASLLKKDPKTKAIPIIFLSALISEADEKVAAKNDVASFLSKPFNREKLLNEIKKYL